MLTEVFTQEPTVDQIKAACNKLVTQVGSYTREKFIIEFSKPSSVIKAGTYAKDILKMKVRVFESKDGVFCYTFGRNRGWPFHKISFQNIKSISLSTAEEAKTDHEIHNLNNIQKAVKLIHPNAWNNLRTDLIEHPDKYKYYGGFLKICKPVKTCGVYLNKSVFDEWALERIKNAFETKTDFSTEAHRRQYDFRIECKNNYSSDSIFRAWYTREVHGGGANWSYLLLNPTTAWFVGKD
jgi:hypothetical protein